MQYYHLSVLLEPCDGCASIYIAYQLLIRFCMISTLQLEFHKGCNIQI